MERPQTASIRLEGVGEVTKVKAPGNIKFGSTGKNFFNKESTPVPPPMEKIKLMDGAVITNYEVEYEEEEE